MIVAIVLAAAVQIQATDYALSLPSTIPSGINTFTFQNKGSEPHYLRFVRIAPGHGIDDFIAWQKSETSIPDWLISSGGIGTVAPGMTEQFTTTLPAGNYAAIC